MSELDLAPIVLFVYNRPEHTKKTLQALSLNKLASKSKLFVYSDGSKDITDIENVTKINKVREIVRSNSWCGELKLIEAEYNIGLADSIKNGVTKIVEKFGKVIVIEDDIITSPAFLTYMNKALNFYINRKSVFFISGFNYPATKMKIPDDYTYDVYVSIRNSSWGWATWADRWNQIDWDIKNYQSLVNSSAIQEAFSREGDDVLDLLYKRQSGELKIWSIQSTFAQFENHGITIFPTQSYVDNVGMDGSGENCGTNEYFKNNVLCQKEEIHFLEILYQDKRIINSYYNVNCRKKRPLWKKIMRRIIKKLYNTDTFVIKKKIYS